MGDDSGMDDELITFVIDGSPERNGAIPAPAFLAKLRVFIAAMYGLDRAFSRRDRTQIELEIVTLSRNSPARLDMRPRSKEAGYDAQAATAWGFAQLVQLRAGGSIDPRISEGTLDNIIDLASWRASKLPDLGVVQIVHGGKVLAIDDALAEQALAARREKREDKARPWRAGVSHGSLFGELRGVMDLDGERQFFIVPPSGPKQVQCTFSEPLRAAMNEKMFKTVRAYGYLHYGGDSPFPNLLEADRLDDVAEPPRHFSELRGMFSGMDAEDLLSEIG